MLLRNLLCSQASALVLVTVLAAGCQDSSAPVPGTSGTAATASPATTPADDPAAVKALEDAGFKLTRGADGRVSEVAATLNTDATEILKNLKGVTGTVTARFGGTGMTDTALQSLSVLTSLKRLDLTECSSAGDGTLQVVSGLPTVEVLILRRAGFTDAGLEFVGRLPALRALDLRNTNVTDAGLRHLSGIKTLVDLQLEKAKITDSGLEALRGLPLKSLNLNYTGIGDDAMPVIGSLTTLESLQMEASRLTDAGMPEIGKLTRLKRFGCRLGDITGAGFQHLAGLKELTRLELRETSVDDDGLEVISGLPKLTFLDLSECRLISSDGIAKLGRLTGLTYLELREIRKVKDATMEALAGLTNLTELNLEATRVTSESVPVILKFQKLQRLSIAGSQIDDAGMVQLGQLPELKWLNLANSEPAPETIAALKAARPGLEIVE